MRILVITPWYPDSDAPYHGFFIQEQARALATRHQVVVLCAKVDYSRFSVLTFTKSEKRYSGFSEIRVKIAKSFPFYNQINYILVCTWIAWVTGRRFKPDVVHGNIGYPGGIWAWLVSKLLGVPYLLSEHTKIENNFRSQWHRSLTIFGYSRAKAIVTVSSWMVNSFSNFRIKNVFMVPNIVDGSRFKLRNNVQQVEIQIGLLGSLFSEKHTKGLDILIYALRMVSFKFHLHVGGAGKMIPWYNDLAKENGIAEYCTFYGGVSPNEVPKFMERLDIFVCASRVESFGIAILEAMAAGVPVLSTDCGGPRDFVNEENGSLVDVNNVKALIVGLTEMHTKLSTFDPRRIRQFVLDNYSQEKFLINIEDVYRRII